METVRLSLSDMQHKNLLSGKSVQVKSADIGRGDSFQFSSRNYNKLLKASHAGKGVRVAFTQEEMKHNSGGMSGGKFKVNVKKLKKAAKVAKAVGDVGAQMYGYDSMVDAGVSKAQEYAAEKGYDGPMTKAAAKFARNQGDRLIDQQLEGGKINWKKVGKTALKVGKFANNASKQLTGDSLTDLAIDYGLENTIGRVDPTGGLATDMIGEQMKKQANKELDKRGSGVNPYMPKHKGGSFRSGGSFRTAGKGVRVYDDSSNYVRPDSASWNPVPPPSYSGGRCAHCGR